MPSNQFVIIGKEELPTTPDAGFLIPALQHIDQNTWSWAFLTPSSSDNAFLLSLLEQIAVQIETDNEQWAAFHLDFIAGFNAEDFLSELPDLNQATSFLPLPVSCTVLDNYQPSFEQQNLETGIKLVSIDPDNSSLSFGTAGAFPQPSIILGMRLGTLIIGGKKMDLPSSFALHLQYKPDTENQLYANEIPVPGLAAEQRLILSEQLALLLIDQDATKRFRIEIAFDDPIIFSFFAADTCRFEISERTACLGLDQETEDYQGIGIYHRHNAPPWLRVDIATALCSNAVDGFPSILSAARQVGFVTPFDSDAEEIPLETPVLELELLIDLSKHVDEHRDDPLLKAKNGAFQFNHIILNRLQYPRRVRVTPGLVSLLGTDFEIPDWTPSGQDGKIGIFLTAARRSELTTNEKSKEDGGGKFPELHVPIGIMIQSPLGFFSFEAVLPFDTETFRIVSHEISFFFSPGGEGGDDNEYLDLYFAALSVPAHPLLVGSSSIPSKDHRDGYLDLVKGQIVFFQHKDIENGELPSPTVFFPGQLQFDDEDNAEDKPTTPLALSLQPFDPGDFDPDHELSGQKVLLIIGRGEISFRAQVASPQSIELVKEQDDKNSPVELRSINMRTIPVRNGEASEVIVLNSRIVAAKIWIDMDLPGLQDKSINAAIGFRSRGAGELPAIEASFDWEEDGKSLFGDLSTGFFSIEITKLRPSLRWDGGWSLSVPAWGSLRIGSNINANAAGDIGSQGRLYFENLDLMELHKADANISFTSREPLAFSFLGNLINCRMHKLALLWKLEEGAKELTCKLTCERTELNLRQQGGLNGGFDFSKLIIRITGRKLSLDFGQTFGIWLSYQSAFSGNGEVTYHEPDSLQPYGELGISGSVQLNGLPPVSALLKLSVLRKQSGGLQAALVVYGSQALGENGVGKQLFTGVALKELGVGLAINYRLAGISANPTARQLTAKIDQLDPTKLENWQPVSSNGIYLALFGTAWISSNVGTADFLNAYVASLLISVDTDGLIMAAGKMWVSASMNLATSNKDRPALVGAISFRPKKKELTAYLETRPNPAVEKNPTLQKILANSQARLSLTVTPNIVDLHLEKAEYTDNFMGVDMKFSGSFRIAMFREAVLARASMAITGRYSKSFEEAGSGVRFDAGLDIEVDFRCLFGSKGLTAYAGVFLSSDFDLYIWVQFKVLEWVEKTIKKLLSWITKKVQEWSFSTVEGRANVHVAFRGTAAFIESGAAGFSGQVAVDSSLCGHSLGFSISLDINEGVIGQAQRRLSRYESDLDRAIQDLEEKEVRENLSARSLVAGENTVFSDAQEKETEKEHWAWLKTKVDGKTRHLLVPMEGSRWYLPLLALGENAEPAAENSLKDYLPGCVSKIELLDEDNNVVHEMIPVWFWRDKENEFSDNLDEQLRKRLHSEELAFIQTAVNVDRVVSDIVKETPLPENPEAEETTYLIKQNDNPEKEKHNKFIVWNGANWDYQEPEENVTVWIEATKQIVTFIKDDTGGDWQQVISLEQAEVKEIVVRDPRLESTAKDYWRTEDLLSYEDGAIPFRMRPLEQLTDSENQQVLSQAARYEQIRTRIESLAVLRMGDAPVEEQRANTRGQLVAALERAMRETDDNSSASAFSPISSSDRTRSLGLIAEVPDETTVNSIKIYRQTGDDETEVLNISIKCPDQTSSVLAKVRPLPIRQGVISDADADTSGTGREMLRVKLPLFLPDEILQSRGEAAAHLGHFRIFRKMPWDKNFEPVVDMIQPEVKRIFTNWNEADKSPVWTKVTLAPDYIFSDDFELIDGDFRDRRIASGTTQVQYYYEMYAPGDRNVLLKRGHWEPVPFSLPRTDSFPERMVLVTSVEELLKGGKLHFRLMSMDTGSPAPADIGEDDFELLTDRSPLHQSGFYDVDEYPIGADSSETNKASFTRISGAGQRHSATGKEPVEFSIDDNRKNIFYLDLSRLRPRVGHRMFIARQGRSEYLTPLPIALLPSYENLKHPPDKLQLRDHLEWLPATGAANYTLPTAVTGVYHGGRNWILTQWQADSFQDGGAEIMVHDELDLNIVLRRKVEVIGAEVFGTSERDFSNPSDWTQQETQLDMDTDGLLELEVTPGDRERQLSLWFVNKEQLVNSKLIANLNPDVQGTPAELFKSQLSVDNRDWQKLFGAVQNYLRAWYAFLRSPLNTNSDTIRRRDALLRTACAGLFCGVKLLPDKTPEVDAQRIERIVEEAMQREKLLRNIDPARLSGSNSDTLLDTIGLAVPAAAIIRHRIGYAREVLFTESKALNLAENVRLLGNQDAKEPLLRHLRWMSLKNTFKGVSQENSSLYTQSGFFLNDEHFDNGSTCAVFFKKVIADVYSILSENEQIHNRMAELVPRAGGLTALLDNWEKDAEKYTLIKKPHSALASNRPLEDDFTPAAAGISDFLPDFAKQDSKKQYSPSQLSTGLAFLFNFFERMGFAVDISAVTTTNLPKSNPDLINDLKNILQEHPDTSHHVFVLVPEGPYSDLPDLPDFGYAFLKIAVVPNVFLDALEKEEVSAGYELDRWLELRALDADGSSSASQALVPLRELSRYARQFKTGEEPFCLLRVDRRRVALPVVPAIDNQALALIEVPSFWGHKFRVTVRHISRYQPLLEQISPNTRIKFPWDRLHDRIWADVEVLRLPAINYTKVLRRFSQLLLPPDEEKGHNDNKIKEEETLSHVFGLPHPTQIRFIYRLNQDGSRSLSNRIAEQRSGFAGTDLAFDYRMIDREDNFSLSKILSKIILEESDSAIVPDEIWTIPLGTGNKSLPLGFRGERLTVQEHLPFFYEYKLQANTRYRMQGGSITTDRQNDSAIQRRRPSMLAYHKPRLSFYEEANRVMYLFEIPLTVNRELLTPAESNSNLPPLTVTPEVIGGDEPQKISSLALPDFPDLTFGFRIYSLYPGQNNGPDSLYEPAAEISLPWNPNFREHHEDEPSGGAFMQTFNRLFGVTSAEGEQEQGRFWTPIKARLDNQGRYQFFLRFSAQVNKLAADEHFSNPENFYLQAIRNEALSMEFLRFSTIRLESK